MLGIPKDVLGHEFAIFHDHILYPIEGVFAMEIDVFDDDVLRFHRKIVGPDDFGIAHFEIMAPPTGLGPVFDLDVLQREVIGFAEGLRGFGNEIDELKVMAIPNGGPCHYLELRTIHREMGRIPHRVFPGKDRCINREVMAFFQWRFAIVK